MYVYIYIYITHLSLSLYIYIYCYYYITWTEQACLVSPILSRAAARCVKPHGGSSLVC